MHSVTPHFLSWPSAQAAVLLGHLDALLKCPYAQLYSKEIDLGLCPLSHITNIPLYTNN